MLRKANSPSRPLAYLLTKLSPLDIADATTAYVQAQSAQAVAALIKRALPRLGNGERRQLGTMFGLRSPEHDAFFDEAAPPQAELAAALDAAGDRIDEPVLRFLRQNPRALAALDGSALKQILADAMERGMHDVEDAVPSQDVVDDEPAPALFESIASSVAQMVAAAVTFVAAFGGFVRHCIKRALWLLALPFVLLYRGCKALAYFVVLPFIAIGRAVVAIPRAVASIRLPRIRIPLIRFPRIRFPQIRFPRIEIPWASIGIATAIIGAGVLVSAGVFAVTHRVRVTSVASAAAVPAHHRIARRPHRPAPARVIPPVAPRPRVTPKPRVVALQPSPAPKATHAPKRHPAPHRKPPMHLARAPHRVRPIAFHPVPRPRAESPLVERARREVASYLASLKRGDNRDALTRLGLAPDAAVSNLTEAEALASGHFRIVDAAARDDGNAKVDVEIHAPGKHFFGVYTVSGIGTAAHITSHTLIPVSVPGEVAGP